MKIHIDVEDAQEAELIRIGLSDPKTRAMVKIMGALLPLESDRARRRVLAFVADTIEEDAEKVAEDAKRESALANNF